MTRLQTIAVALAASAAAFVAPSLIFAQTTVVDQIPIPVPGTSNTTLNSEWLLQSYAPNGSTTCYQAFIHQPGVSGSLLSAGLNCLQNASQPASIVGSASPFPIAGQAGTQGGAVSVTGGVSSTTGNAGGAAQLVGGAGGATGAGGAAQVIGAAGGTTSGTGGAASVTAGAGTAGNAAGGVASEVGGAGQGTGVGGQAQVTGGASGAGATGNGGAVVEAGGAALSTNGTGGAISITGGAGAGTGNGGAASVVGGAAGTTGVGGAVAITAGSPTAGNGSTVTVTASAGAGGTNAGGNINLVPGAAVSTGAPGVVQVNGNAGLICPAYYYTGTIAATNQVFFVAPRAMLVEQIGAIWSVAAGGASTISITHDTGTGAPASGTDMLGTDFNLNTTANTYAAGSLSATVATLTLAAGDRIAIKYNNTIQSTAGLVVTVCLAPQ